MELSEYKLNCRKEVIVYFDGSEITIIDGRQDTPANNWKDYIGSG